MSRLTGVVMSADAIEALLAVEFPQLFDPPGPYRIEAVGSMTARVRFHVDDRHLRPGGTVSGPSMFTLADLCLYVAVLAQLGPVTQTVTTSMTLNFLRRPRPGDLVGTCALLKLGRRLAVGEVRITAPEGGEPVAHATGTYALPPTVS